ncbi:MAG TPA: type VI secretion system contractile sheath small subunit [Planctomycetes bacterium]|nr:type VI secretion system contractile sheath small subunit [Planctomycetota bacterium]
MASEGSVAPKERVNIVYKTDTGGAQQEKELPFKMLVTGDFTQRADARPIEQRKPISVNKDNFDDVLASQKLKVELGAKNTLAADGGELPVQLEFKSLKDFGPEAVARQVPELSKLLELREALNALKGPLGNIPAFRKKIQAIIADETARAQILTELGGKPA